MYVIRRRSRRIDRELDALPARDYSLVEAAIDALASEPRPYGCLQLEDDIYRIRVGSHRVFYQIDEEHQEILLGAVRRRNERTYRNIRDLFR